MSQPPTTRPPATQPSSAHGTEESPDTQLGTSDPSVPENSFGGNPEDSPLELAVKPDGDRKLSPLSTVTRVLLLIVGWLLLLIGIAGLVLPGIQGILTIVAGAAVLSLASELVYRIILRALSRWPGVLARVERLRAKIHSWVSRG